jgi:hypothetical protein
MKLLFCEKCWDVFKLDDDLRQCKCGLVKGKYINDVDAVVNGAGYSIAIGNGSLLSALNMLAFIEKEFDAVDHDRDVFIDKCSITFSWVRPHEGPGNPHTKIDKEL